MEPSICFITGPCSAGKSTVGLLLAQASTIQRAMFIEADSIRRCVWRGYVTPYPDTSAAREQIVLAAKAVSRIANLYKAAGFSVFIEDVLEPWLLPVYQAELQHPTTVVCLLPNQTALQKRDAMKPPGEQLGARCLDLWNSFNEWSQTHDWIVLDSSRQQPDQTVRRVLAMLGGPKQVGSGQSGFMAAPKKNRPAAC